LVYKRGYLPVVKYSQTIQDVSDPAWGQSVALTKANENARIEAYLEGMKQLMTELNEVMTMEDCRWLAVEKTLLSIHLESMRLTREGIQHSIDPRRKLMDADPHRKCNVSAYFPT
jgi:hypothetical protein